MQDGAGTCLKQTHASSAMRLRGAEVENLKI